MMIITMRCHIYIMMIIMYCHIYDDDNHALSYMGGNLLTVQSMEMMSYF